MLCPNCKIKLSIHYNWVDHTPSETTEHCKRCGYHSYTSESNSFVVNPLEIKMAFRDEQIKNIEGD